MQIRPLTPGAHRSSSLRPRAIDIGSVDNARNPMVLDLTAP